MYPETNPNTCSCQEHAVTQPQPRPTASNADYNLAPQSSNAEDVLRRHHWMKIRTHSWWRELAFPFLPLLGDVLFDTPFSLNTGAIQWRLAGDGDVSIADVDALVVSLDVLLVAWDVCKESLATLAGGLDDPDNFEDGDGDMTILVLDSQKAGSPSACCKDAAFSSNGKSTYRCPCAAQKQKFRIAVYCNTIFIIEFNNHPDNDVHRKVQRSGHHSIAIFETN